MTTAMRKLGGRRKTIKIRNSEMPEEGGGAGRTFAPADQSSLFQSGGGQIMPHHINTVPHRILDSTASLSE